ncbi:unnamed protein product [Prunus armeniaca]|uniref:TCP domain-containing protein n=1 Tax=Prunus armeniaca TaxID=36596 RepID=A0A6J5X680_PRUAR|nr:unnamed protein product [Prunus armeniaca]
MSHLQDILRLQMLQQRGSKNEDQDQPEDVQEEEQQSQKRLIGQYQHVQEPPNYGPLNGKMLNTHIAKSSRKSCYSMSSSSSSHLASEQAEINNARYGKIVKVHGGHIVRSTARKERHSKVYTSKGPRDRRFRLSAPTAIQFYDVQDRLGYDRPSKAIDWLMRRPRQQLRLSLSLNYLEKRMTVLMSATLLNRQSKTLEKRVCVSFSITREAMVVNQKN